MKVRVRSTSTPAMMIKINETAARIAASSARTRPMVQGPFSCAMVRSAGLDAQVGAVQQVQRLRLTDQPDVRGADPTVRIEHQLTRLADHRHDGGTRNRADRLRLVLVLGSGALQH